MHINEPLIPNNSKGNSETNKFMVHRIQQKISQFRYYAIFFTNFRTNQITLTTNKDTRLVMNKIWSSLMF